MTSDNLNYTVLASITGMTKKALEIEFVVFSSFKQHSIIRHIYNAENVKKTHVRLILFTI